jgi:hypothetical protein
MRKKNWQLLIVLVLIGASACGSSLARETPNKSAWKEVLYQAFQSGALSATIILNEQVIRVPVGWDSVPEPKEPDNRWTMARWDGGNDRRVVERTYLVTNKNGLPNCWLTKILSYEVGPEFELQCIAVNYGTPAALFMRVLDDEGKGYDAVVSMGVESQKTRIREIVKPHTAKVVGEPNTVEPETVKDLAVSTVKLPTMERLQWYQVKLAYKNRRFVLSVDDQVVARSQPTRPSDFTTVQFMSPQRIFLDDFQMWGEVKP